MRNNETVSLRQVRADWERVKCEVAYVRVLFLAQRYREALIRDAKYNPNHDEIGRFTTGDGAVAPGSEVGKTLEKIATDAFNAAAELFHHDYTSGPNVICPAELNCTSQEIADHLSRVAYPGQDLSVPVIDQQLNFVEDPRSGIPGGYVVTRISPDGLTIINTTRPLHVFYPGLITRTATQSADGSWSVTTRGVGYNIWAPGLALINQEQCPKVFDFLDQRLRDNIERHHGITKAIEAAAFGNSRDGFLWAGNSLANIGEKNGG